MAAMCAQCMAPFTSFELVALSAAATTAAASTGTKQALRRLGLRRRTAQDRDADVAAFLADLGLDPTDHADLHPEVATRWRSQRPPLSGDPTVPVAASSTG